MIIRFFQQLVGEFRIIIKRYRLRYIQHDDFQTLNICINNLDLIKPEFILVSIRFNNKFLAKLRFEEIFTKRRYQLQELADLSFIIIKKTNNTIFENIDEPFGPRFVKQFIRIAVMDFPFEGILKSFNVYAVRYLVRKDVLPGFR